LEWLEQSQLDHKSIQAKITKFAKKWAAPEVIKSKEFSFASDVYSFGICLWEILEYGTVPFPDCSNTETMNKVTVGERPSQPSNCPSKLFRLMQQCWSENPSQRPDFDLILQTLVLVLKDFMLENKKKSLADEHESEETKRMLTETSDKMLKNSYSAADLSTSSEEIDPDSNSDNPKESRNEKEEVSEKNIVRETLPNMLASMGHESEYQDEYDDNFKM